MNIEDKSKTLSQQPKGALKTNVFTENIFERSQESISLAQDVIDTIYFRGGDYLYNKYVLQKLPFHVNQQIVSILKCFQPNLNSLQCKDEINIRPVHENYELYQNTIDSWAVQSMKCELRNHNETMDFSITQKVSQKSLNKTNKFKQALKNKNIVVNKEVQQPNLNFERLPSVESEVEPEDPEEANLFRVGQRLKLERKERDQLKEQSVNQENDRPVNSSRTFEPQYNNEKKQKLEIISQEIAVVTYRDFNLFVNKEPYENLGFKAKNPMIKKDNNLIDQYEQNSKPKNEKKEKKNKEVQIEDLIQLQMGVNLIKENGDKIVGPEYDLSNRVKKSEYNKQVGHIKSDMSIQSKSIITKNKECKSEFVKMQEKIDESEIRNENSFYQGKQFQLEIPQNGEDFAQKYAVDKQVKIFKEIEYGKLIFTLNRDQQNYRIYSAKGPVKEELKSKKQVTNRIHSYRPEILMPNSVLNQQRNSQKIETFNNNIINDKHWGDNENRDQKKKLPNILIPRVKSAVQSQRKKKVNV